MVTSISPQRDPTAVMGLRIAAFVIDLAVLFIISVAILLAAFFSMAQRSPSSQVTCPSASLSMNSSTGTTTDSTGKRHPQFCVQDGTDVLYIPVADESTFSSTFYLSGFLLGVVDLVVLQGLTGASLGKLLVGLKVIRADGGPVGVGRALIRYLLLVVDAGCCFIVGVLSSFTSAGHRRVGDMAAHTLVVSRREIQGAVPAPTYTPPGAFPSGPPTGFPPSAPPPPVQWPQPSAPTTARRPSDDPSAGGDGPFWDQARDTYIHYDRASQAWVEWNEAAHTWIPISR